MPDRIIYDNNEPARRRRVVEERHYVEEPVAYVEQPVVRRTVRRVPSGMGVAVPVILAVLALVLMLIVVGNRDSTGSEPATPPPAPPGQQG